MVIPVRLPLHPVLLQRNGTIVLPVPEAENANSVTVQDDTHTQKMENVIHVPEAEQENVPDVMAKADGISNKNRKIMMKRNVGKVTLEEAHEIQTLFERRNGLNELARIVTADNAELYEKLVKDLGETGTRFQQWWDRMAEKYQWERAENGNWEIDFETGEITLVTA